MFQNKSLLESSIQTCRKLLFFPPVSGHIDTNNDFSQIYEPTPLEETKAMSVRENLSGRFTVN